MTQSQSSAVGVMIAFALAFTLADASADARGERSVRLVERIMPVPAARVQRMRGPRWTRPADPPKDEAPLLALSRDVAAFTLHGSMCGFALRDGTRAWCAGPGRAPVSGRDQIVFSSPDGAIRSVSARNGAARWTYAPRSARSGTTAAGSGGAASVWRASAGYLVARDDGAYFELGLDGSLLWMNSMKGRLNDPLIAGRFAVQPTVGSGATLQFGLYTVKLGRHGGILRELSHGAVISLGPPVVAISRDVPPNDIRDAFLTADLEIADALTGHVAVRQHYEPDYDRNARIHDALPGGAAAGAGILGVSGASVYVSAGNHIYRYALGGVRGQHPVDLGAVEGFATTVRHGWLYRSRRNGFSRIHFANGRLESQALAPTRAGIARLFEAGGTLYASFDSGELFGFESGSGRRVLETHACAARQIAAEGGRVVLACAGSDAWKIVAVDAR